MSWLILLFATAVILPTVCLLWFMTQAVRNERLAVRQKLVDAYRPHADRYLKHLNGLWPKSIVVWNDIIKTSTPARIFDRCVPPQHVREWTHLQYRTSACVVYDAERKVIYPTESSEPALEIENPQAQTAWRLEFVDHDYEQAIEVYQKMQNKCRQGNHNPNEYLCRKAALGQARCFRALGRIDEAIAVYQRAGTDPDRRTTPQCKALISRARFASHELRLNSAEPEIDEFYDALVNMQEIADSCPDRHTRRFLLRRAVNTAEKHADAIKHNKNVRFWFDLGKRRLAAEELAERIAALYPSPPGYANWSSGTFHRFDLTDEYYYQYLRVDERIVLRVFHASDIQGFFRHSFSSGVEDAVFRVVDETGRLVAGPGEVSSKPFLVKSLEPYFPNWQLQCFF